MGDHMKLWLIIGLFFAAVPQTTQPDVVLERFAKVQRFAFGPTGYAGAISTGERDYRIVLARSSAQPDFERLFAEGNVQAKSYALVGIHKLNPIRFRELARVSNSSKEIVATMKGCIVSHERFTSIIKRIESGTY
jgi:hypothetical protein